MNWNELEKLYATPDEKIELNRIKIELNKHTSWKHNPEVRTLINMRGAILHQMLKRRAAKESISS